MHEVDGSDGGGELLRSSLSFAMLTGESVRVENVRGDRPEPGLKPQHLAALELAAAVCDASVERADPGSSTVVFDPGRVRGGSYHVDVGTAGSVSLVFDTVLPVAPLLDDPLTVTATGGTHVAWSPPLTALAAVKLPLLRRHGLHAVVGRDRPGFYPQGGGRARLHVAPSRLDRFDLDDRGNLSSLRVHSLASESLRDASVADRQATAALDGLTGRGYETVEHTITYAETDCPGSAILLEADYENARAGFDALGERGTAAETVAERAVEAFEAFERGGGAVDRHLADQLLVLLAVAGGRLRVPEVTDHVATSRDLLERFGAEVSTTDESSPLLSVSNAITRQET